MLAAGQLYGPPRQPPVPLLGGGSEVVIDSSGELAATPRWSSDGEWLVYTKCDSEGTPQVWRCASSGGTPQQLTFDDCDKVDIGCSPTAQYVIFHYDDGEGHSRIGRVDIDGNNQIALSPEHEDCTDGRWSPDGSYIAYLRQSPDYSWKVWRMDADGGSRQQLSSGTGDCLTPAPADNFVAYPKVYDGFTQIFFVPTQGGGETLLTDRQFDHRRPSLSPTSDWISFECEDSTGYVQVRRVRKSKPLHEVIVTSSNCDNEAPIYTSDGEYIVFKASDSSGAQVCEVPALGDSVAALTPVAWDYDECRCSPDSRWVVYAKEDSLFPDVGIVKVRRFLDCGLSAFSLDKTRFDATRDSVRIDFSIESDASVTLFVRKGTVPVRVILYGAQLDAGDYQYYWGGDSGASQSLMLPGPDYSVKIIASGSGWSDTAVAPCSLKGTIAPLVIYHDTTWDTLHDPYVLTGHNLNINNTSGSATLTIQPGVRVMFHDSVVSRTIYVHTDDRIEALGTAQKPVYFMLHRKMAEGFDPAKRGWWGGIHFEGHSNGAKFNNCVFENGGYNVVYSSTPNSWVLVDFDSCQFRGACGRAIQVDSDSARERIRNSGDIIKDSGYALYSRYYNM